MNLTIFTMFIKNKLKEKRKYITPLQRTMRKSSTRILYIHKYI